MTKQIDELMRLVPGIRSGRKEYTAACQALRTALEAALEPGDKVAALQAIVDSNTGFKRDTAPPAQTPPRLTDEQLSQVMEQVDFTYAPTKFARAIESAVRRQFGVQE